MLALMMCAYRFTTWLTLTRHADALQQYCRGKGLDPDSVMPCVVDAGTDDVRLQSSEDYKGVKTARLPGSALHQVC